MFEISPNLSIETVVARLALATFLAMLIGFEREWHRKPAGLRTHMLVGLGAAAFFLISIEFSLGPLKDAEGLSPDPTRIFQGVIAGIGFLGAGAIIQGRGNVRGLTTGAGIWVAGAVGLASGGGYVVIAVMLTVFTLLILVVAGYLEHRFLDDKGSDDAEADKS
jgi:putative Mg2+ transporter-C (MgtC) family protein